MDQNFVPDDSVQVYSEKCIVPQENSSDERIGSISFENDYVFEPSDEEFSVRAVHQCNVCSKVFVSFKGLQQHTVIHTDLKPYQCDICAKAFRFKSNLFEHRSVHTGFALHTCQYCGKACRLKGNLKKHLRTHVSTMEELEEAWRPFMSHRRPPARIPENAIVFRTSGEPMLSPLLRCARKRKLGLGTDWRLWADKCLQGEIVPTHSLDEKIMHAENMIMDKFDTEELFKMARAIPLELYHCPLCELSFMSQAECFEHVDIEHPSFRNDYHFSCNVCMRYFANHESYSQHVSYHKRVKSFLYSSKFSEVNAEDNIDTLVPREMQLVQ